MPARIVPKNYRNLTGLVYNSRTRALSAFESTLERDYLVLLDFDPAVNHYEEQPLTIKYRDSAGRCRRYTPDVFVSYHRVRGATSVPSALCEIKYRDDLRQHWAEYKPKFRAAHRYTREHGWCFRLVTEREIRTPFLENAKFLRQYQDFAVDETRQRQLLQALVEQRATDLAGLLSAITDDRWQRAQLLPVLWQLIAQRKVGVDLEQPLKMGSRLWSTASAEATR
jgi:hypothetical protein